MRIALYEKPLDIRLSRSAEAALSQHTGTLLAEMELIFGCMIRKSVVFREWDADVEVDAVETGSRLAVRFAPTMTRAACAATGNDHDLEESSPALATRYRLDNPSPYVPQWLAVDYRRDQWHGEFGYGEQVGA